MVDMPVARLGRRRRVEDACASNRRGSVDALIYACLLMPYLGCREPDYGDPSAPGTELQGYYRLRGFDAGRNLDPSRPVVSALEIDGDGASTDRGFEGSLTYRTWRCGEPEMPVSLIWFSTRSPPTVQVDIVGHDWDDFEIRVRQAKAGEGGSEAEKQSRNLHCDPVGLDAHPEKGWQPSRNQVLRVVGQPPA